MTDVQDQACLVAERITAGYQRQEVLREVSLTVRRGETVGLVGESGSGKSTLARVLVGTLRPTEGRVLLDGQSLLRGRRGRQQRRRMQLIPQDPYTSLDPRMTVGATLAEAVEPRHGGARRNADRIEKLLNTVSLDADVAQRYPHEFSGGQRQRIAIARALAVEPQVIIADEITSALDASVQAEVLNILVDLREQLDLTMLFISHDLAVVRHVSDAVVVMRDGAVVERGDRDDIFAHPQEPYTQLLLDSIPGQHSSRVTADVTLTKEHSCG